MTGAAVRNNVQMYGPENGPVLMFAHGFGTDQSMWGKILLDGTHLLDLMPAGDRLMCRTHAGPKLERDGHLGELSIELLGTAGLPAGSGSAWTAPSPLPVASSGWACPLAGRIRWFRRMLVRQNTRNWPGPAFGRRSGHVPGQERNARRLD